MAKVGRPPVSPAVVALVQELAQEPGASLRAIVSRAKDRGTRVSFETVRRIVNGDHCKTPGKLAAAETQLQTPVRCPGCGGMIAIVPCRKCAAVTAQKLDPQLRRMREVVARGRQLRGQGRTSIARRPFRDPEA